MIVKAAVIQMTPGADKAQNWAAAEHWIAQAAAAGAQWVSLPETFVYSGSHRPDIMHTVAEPIPGPTSQLLSQWAKQYQIYLIGGSFFELNSQDLTRPFNTCLVYGPEGELLAKYRKNHLFTLKTSAGADKTARDLSESTYQTQGKPSDRSVAITPLGNVGLSICYDLRFPDLYQYYSRVCRATLLAVPSKFLKTTGEAHWLPLLQARAIENQCFVLAANAYSETQPPNYGHSAIIDPWGKVLAQLTTGEGVCCADLDLAYLAQVRKRLPVHEQGNVGINR